jgi:hypothetical protein
MTFANWASALGVSNSGRGINPVSAAIASNLPS